MWLRLKLLLFCGLCSVPLERKHIVRNLWEKPHTHVPRGRRHPYKHLKWKYGNLIGVAEIKYPTFCFSLHHLCTGVCSFCWIAFQFMHASIAFLIGLQWKRENLLGEKQPKFTKTSTPQFTIKSSKFITQYNVIFLSTLLSLLLSILSTLRAIQGSD